MSTTSMVSVTIIVLRTWNFGQNHNPQDKESRTKSTGLGRFFCFTVLTTYSCVLIVAGSATSSLPTHIRFCVICGVFVTFRAVCHLLLVVSLFLHHVSVVVPDRSREQVIWVNAWRVVATVQYMKSWWDRTSKKFPRKTVNQFLPGSASAEPYHPVTLPVDCSGPGPASIRLSHP